MKPWRSNGRIPQDGIRWNGLYSVFKSKAEKADRCRLGIIFIFMVITLCWECLGLGVSARYGIVVKVVKNNARAAHGLSQRPRYSGHGLAQLRSDSP